MRGLRLGLGLLGGRMQTAPAISAAQAYFTLVENDGGTISEARKAIITAWFNASSSYRSKIIRANFFLTDDFNGLFVPIVNNAGNAKDANTNFVSGDYSVSVGLTGNGSDKYLNTGVDPYVEGISADDFGLFSYNISTPSFALSSVETMLGVNSAADNGADLSIDDDPSAITELIMRLGGSGATPVSDDYSDGLTGLFGSSGNGSSGATNQINETVGSTQAINAWTAATGSIYVFARNAAGTADQFFSAGLGGYIITNGMTPSEIAQMTTDLTELQVALGRYDASAAAHFTALASNGGITDERKLAVNNLVLRLKTASLWSSIIRMNVFAGSALAGALIPLVADSGDATETNNNFVEGDYSTNGLKGDGSTKYLETGLIPWVEGLDGVNCGFHFYSTEDGAQNGYFMGAIATLGNASSLGTRDRDGVNNLCTTYGDLGFENFIDYFSLVDTRGLISACCDADGARIYRRGRSLSPQTTTVADALAWDQDLYIFGRNTLGTVDSYSKNRCGLYAVTTAMTPAQNWSFNSIIQQYQVDCGRGYTNAKTNIAVIGDTLPKSLTLSGNAFLDGREISRNLGVLSETSDQILTRFTNDPAGKASDVWVIWAGSYNIGDSAQVLSDIADMVAELVAAGNNKYIVLTPLTQDTADHYIGGADRTSIEAIWSGIASAYPDNYLDIHSFLTAQATSPDDDTDVTNGVTPGTLRTDAIRLNSLGNILVSDFIWDFITTTKGW